MAQSAWLKKYLRMKPEVVKLFDDLDDYRMFCVNQGYVFNEKDLYDERSSFGDYIKFKKGKSVKDNWTNLIRQTRKD